MRLLARFLAAAALACVILPASSQTAPSAEQIERARAAGAAASALLRNQTLKRDADGNVVRDANGQPVTQTTDADSRRQDAQQVQSYFGITGVEQQSVPTGGTQATGLAAISTTNYVDFSCKTDIGRTMSAGAHVFRPQICGMEASGQVRNVVLAYCDGLTRGATCSVPRSFSQQMQLDNGGFRTYGSIEVGLGCNSVGLCRLTVQATEQLGGRADQLAQRAEVVAAEEDSVASDLRTMQEEGDYANRMREMGALLQRCADRNRQSYDENGIVMTCDEDGTGQVAMGNPGGAKCEGERTCAKETVTRQTFSRSCVRTFPLTERIRTLEYDRTLTCQLANVNGFLTNSCSDEELAGMTRVGTTDGNCTASKEPGGFAKCEQETWTEYYVGARVEKSIVASPTPIGGACDLRPNADTRYSQCLNNNWFGRTADPASCVIPYVDESSGAYAGIGGEYTDAERPGCGVCLTEQVGDVCYGTKDPEYDEPDSCTGMDLRGCTLVSTQPQSFSSSDGGLVASQMEKYRCVRENRICLQYQKGEGENACFEPGDMTFGTDQTKETYSDSSLNAALVSAAILESTAQGIEGEQDTVVPLIFGGEDMRCVRATGGIGQLFGKNCCRMDLERPKEGNIIQRGCSMDEVKLAAARRSNYTTRIGEYCSKRSPWPSKRCLRRTETFCAFAGLLPRLVQEQGREQLIDIVMSGHGASAQTKPLHFGYYHEGEGGWTPPVDVNGVKVAAYQWPRYCASSSDIGNMFNENPFAKECPSIVSTWIAACEAKDGCGDLPDEPYQGSLNWVLQPIDPLKNVSTALSRLSVVSGACSPQTQACSFNVSALPVASGGRAVVTRDLSWPLYLNTPPEPGATPPVVYQMNNIDDLMFKGFSIAGMSDGRTVPARVRVDFSRDGGQTWNSYQVPTNLKNSEFVFPGSDVKMFGSCDALTNVCSYRVTGTTVITAKPWGTPTAPDCSGFTAGQLAALDFGKMDLSEWLAEVMENVKSSNPDVLASQASDQVRAFNEIFAGGAGGIKATHMTTGNFARVMPPEGFGPFQVRLVVSGFWPKTTGDAAQDQDRVIRVDVDWGDCTGIDALTPLQAAAGQGTGFVGLHTFDAPDKLLCGAKNGNVTHEIKLTVYTSKSGIQHRTLQVENAYSRFPGGSKNNDNVESTTTAPVNPGNKPLPPR